MFEQHWNGALITDPLSDFATALLVQIHPTQELHGTLQVHIALIEGNPVRAITNLDGSLRGKLVCQPRPLQ